MSDLPGDSPVGPPRGAPAPPTDLDLGERSSIVAYLNHQRLGLLEICRDLSHDEMARRAVPPSDISLLAMIRHLAGVEHHWFRRVLGERLDLPYRWIDDPSRGFATVATGPAALAEAWQDWQDEVSHAELLIADLPDDALAIDLLSDGDTTVSVRDLLVHVIEEYARHLGHADLIRERLLAVRPVR